MPVNLVCLDKQIIIVSVNLLLVFNFAYQPQLQVDPFNWEENTTLWRRSLRQCNEKLLLFRPHQSKTDPCLEHMKSSPFSCWIDPNLVEANLNYSFSFVCITFKVIEDTCHIYVFNREYLHCHLWVPIFASTNKCNDPLSFLSLYFEENFVNYVGVTQFWNLDFCEY